MTRLANGVPIDPRPTVPDPSFRDWVRQYQADLAAHRQRPRIPLTALVATSFAEDFSVGSSDLHGLQMLDTVYHWCEDRRGAQVRHKPHPGERSAAYGRTAHAFGWCWPTYTLIPAMSAPIDGVSPLHWLLQTADVCVTLLSTVIFEALVLGCPVIVWDLFRSIDPGDPLRDLPGCTVCHTVDGVRATLDGIRMSPRRLGSPFVSPQLERYTGVLDGQATARVAALLEVA